MTFDARSETLDAILGGALAIVQPLSGYRFSLDSILLGGFADPRPRDRVLELGAGCGVISLMLAARKRGDEFAALEVQSQLAALARRNAQLNCFTNLHVIEADLRALHITGLADASFDYIVANPPYHAAGRGRESPHPGRRVARGDGGAELHEFIAAAARYCRAAGRIAIILTATRLAETIRELHSRALEPKRLRFVHPYLERPASSVLIEARKGGGRQTQVEPPLIVWRAPGEYTGEVRNLLAGRG